MHWEVWIKAMQDTGCDVQSLTNQGHHISQHVTSTHEIQGSL